MPMFYEPTSEMLAKLNQPWCASYSGGKDSTSLVTWIEWLRRSGQIAVKRPQLVQVDTTVEYVELQKISSDMMSVLRRSGWECAVVEPRINEKLYNRILGVGVTPVHPGGRNMRWCTRSTKIDPMKRWRKVNSSGLTLTGLRMGESDIRDGKILKRASCSAGGECGIPDPSDDTYSPIIGWTTCKVLDWLDGNVSRDVRKLMTDILYITRSLIEIYDVRVGQPGFDGWVDPDVDMARFGCIGCSAIEASADAPPSVVSRNGPNSPLNRLYGVWFKARLPMNRLHSNRPGKNGAGPIKMSVRKELFAEVMEIQRLANVILINADDEAFIRQCWANNVYPRGWSAADELTSPAIELERDAPLLNLTINGKANVSNPA